MKVYENDFVYGRELMKKVLIAAVIFCVATIITKANPTLNIACFVLAILSFVAVIYIDVKYCRCPHCGRVIFLGVLAVESCRKCRYNLITGKKVKKSKRK